MNLPTYTVVYELEPDGSAWNVSVSELPGVFTWARSIRKAREHAKEAISLWLDKDEAHFHIQDEFRLPSQLAEELDLARQTRDQSKAAQLEARRAARQVASRLVNDGHLTFRDAGEVLGISYQRVEQLLKESHSHEEAS